MKFLRRLMQADVVADRPPRGPAAVPTVVGTSANLFDGSLLDTILEQGVEVFDADLRLVAFNHRYVEIYDYPPHLIYVGARYEDILRFNAVRDQMDVDIDAYVAERVAQARDPNAPRHREHLRPNGTIIATDHGPIPGGGFINTYTDITKLRAAHNEAVRNAALLRTTLENMADGVRVFDKDLRLVAWNSKSLEMLNYPPELGKVGTPYADFVEYSARRGDYRGETSTDGLEQHMARAKSGIGRSSETFSPDGRIIQKHRDPMPDGGFVSTYQDVTERKHTEIMLQEAKERAEQASRSKSEFLANMSHELRTPLNAIIGFSQIMADELLGPLGSDTYRGYAHDIQESGVHLMTIINDILDLSKVEAGKTQLNEDNVDPVGVAKSCLHLMEERARIAGVTLAGDLPSESLLVRCDERLLRQIILNLLSNAVKFTPSGGRITVSVKIVAGEGMTFTVADTGIGIAEENIQKVMEPFMQVDSSLARKFAGTGLGLPLVASFTRLHGGSFKLKSKLNEGTLAIVRMPADRVIAQQL